MADGELGAAFRALARDAAEAAEKALSALAKLSESTAEIEERNLAEILAADARAAERVRAAAERGGEVQRGAAGAGPPWPVADGVPGTAHGKKLHGPNKRHTVSGSGSGEVKAGNTVILRGHESAVRNDVRLIAEGKATWSPRTGVYRINGRSYRVEPTGAVYPVDGPGLVPLNRVEFAAMAAIVRAGGDVSKVQEFSRDPKFISNPEAIAKAKSIYDGKYPG